MDENQPILLVFHEEDGDWEFLSSNKEDADGIVLVHLGHVLDWDPTVGVLRGPPEGMESVAVKRR